MFYPVLKELVLNRLDRDGTGIDMQTFTTSGERRLKIGIILSVIAIDALWVMTTDMAFDLPSLRVLAPVTCLMLAIAFFYHRIRKDVRLASMAEETIYLLVFSAAAAVLSSLIVTWNLPFYDADLIRIDSWLGFDWTSYVSFFIDRTTLFSLSKILYISTLPLIAVTVVGLCMSGRIGRASELLIAVMISALAAIVISGVLPAAGAVGTYKPPVEFYGPVLPFVPTEYKQELFDLRSGALTLLSLEEPKGLIAFPSYHAALACLLILAVRGMGILFWAMLVINTAVIFTTPVQGGHHLIDGFGGAVLALCASAVTIRIRKHLAEKASGRKAAPATGTTAVPAE